MKKWLVVLMAAWLTACSRGGESKSYYQLPLVQYGAQSTVSQGRHQLWIDQIVVADYLAGNGVVYQTSDVQYQIASNNLWASPLDQQLKNSLVANMSGQLPGWVVASQPLGSAQDQLSITVTGFHGRYDGRAIVSGEWLLNRQGSLTKQPFHIELKQEQDGYDALVKELALAWQKEAANIATELKRLP